MNSKSSFRLQSLLITLLFNGGLLVALYFLLGSGQPLVLFGVGAAVTLALWATLQAVGSKLIEQAAASAPALEAKAPPKAVAAPAPPPKQEPDEAPALQMLALLQRKGRLIDFLQEDLSAFQDAQIGAAVRSIHAGCKQAIEEHVTLEPILLDTEGSTVTVPAGFDAHAIRLIGHVAGDPPFKGALRHRGWRAANVALPERTKGADETVLAPAEVEVA